MPELKMPDINHVLIAGKLTNEPVFRKTANGSSVTSFHLASNRKYRDNSGVWRENSCYVGVVAWNKLAESTLKIVKNGSAVMVEGEMQSRSWRNEDGTARNIVEIRARRIQLLDKKNMSAVDIESQINNHETDLTEKQDSLKVPEQKNDQIDKPESDKIEPTDFDFGYQNLKL